MRRQATEGGAAAGHGRVRRGAGGAARSRRERHIRRRATPSAAGVRSGGSRPRRARPAAPRGLASVAAPSSAASDALPPPRRATIPLASGSGQAGDGELAAGDDAFERGDLAAAERSYAAARAAGAKSAAARRPRARAASRGPACRSTTGPRRATPRSRRPRRSSARREAKRAAFGPAFVELGRARLCSATRRVRSTRSDAARELLPDEPEAHSQLGVALARDGPRRPGGTRALARRRSRSGQRGSSRQPRHRALDDRAHEGSHRPVRASGADRRRRRARALRSRDRACSPRSDLERVALRARARDEPRAERARRFHSNLGYALQQAGRFDRAIAEYREAIRARSDARERVDQPRDHPREESRRRRREARAALGRAAAASPDDPRVKANLDELDALEKGIAPPSSTPTAPAPRDRNFRPARERARRSARSVRLLSIPSGRIDPWSVLDVRERNPLAYRAASASSPWRRRRQQAGMRSRPEG